MMMFTRLGRSISQSYRSSNVFGGGNGGRSQTWTRSSVYQSRCIRQAEDNLGTLKHYFGSVAANNGSGVSSKVYISDINSILRIPRFFSSEAPKNEDDGNFCSKEKRETPKENNQKSESKEESSTEEIIFTLLIGFLASLVLILAMEHREEQKIDFETFKNGYFKRRLVDHIVIINNSVAEVHYYIDPPGPYVENIRLKVYMNIESKETF